MAEVKSLRSVTLPLPPSCIQFCPTNPRLFVVGTYFLHRNDRQGYEPAQPGEDVDAAATENAESSQAPQKRTGSLILYELSPENNITELSTTATDFAILDIQWTLHPDQQLGAVLAVATSTGLLAFYRLATAAASSDITQQQQQQPQLVESCIQQIADDKTLVLSLTWHPHRPDVLGLTLSDGQVCLCTSGGLSEFKWSHDSVLSLVNVHKHELEAWMVSFTPESAMVLSGGDDMVLQCSRVRSKDDYSDDDGERLCWQDRRLHEAGVTAILPLADSLVVTGSYDDHIRLLSLPAVGRRKVLAELNLGGGVWRLKLLTHSSASASSPSQPNGLADEGAAAALQDCTRLTLLCSCMHAGTRIVSLIRVREDEWKFNVLARFEEHKSMNYGSDVLQRGGGGEGNLKTVVSTSFYDQLMCVWQVDLDALERVQNE